MFIENISNTVGVGFFSLTLFFLPKSYQFLAHNCQNQDIDLEFKMENHFCYYLHGCQFGDHILSNLDFVFVGGDNKERKKTCSGTGV